MASKSPLLLGDLLTKISKYHVDYEAKLDAEAERIGLEKTLEDPRVKAPTVKKLVAMSLPRPTQNQKEAERLFDNLPVDSDFVTAREKVTARRRAKKIRDLLQRIAKGKSSIEVLREQYPDVHAIYCEHWGPAFPAEETRFHYRKMFDFVVGVISKYPEATCLGEHALDGYALARLPNILTDSDDEVPTVLETLDKRGVAQHLLGMLWKHFEKECREAGLPEVQAADAKAAAAPVATRPVEEVAAKQAERGEPEQESDNANAAPKLRIDADARLAYWGSRQLSITSHVDFDVLQALYGMISCIVPYAELLRTLKPREVSDAVGSINEAPPEVKDAVKHIRQAFRTAECPLTIKNVRARGYRLQPPPSSHK